jgi:hypothetical protein
MRGAPSKPEERAARTGRAARLSPWALRVVWAALPLAAGPRLAAALDARSPAVRSAASVGLWAGWAVVLLATLVPHPLALTAVRIGAPAGAAAVGAALVWHSGKPWEAAVALVAVVAATGVAFSAPVGMAFVNGPAYPDERRFPLRPPGALLLGPLPVAWGVAVGGPAATVLLLAAGRWWAGAAAGAAGLPAAAVMARSLHGLARRWLVFVPAGVVLHDPLSVADPVLFRRQVIDSLGPAPAGSDSLDLTQAAPGLALELVLREKVAMVLVRPGRRGDEAGASARLLFTPSRPGRVLDEARARRLAVG